MLHSISNKCASEGCSETAQVYYCKIFERIIDNLYKP